QQAREVRALVRGRVVGGEGVDPGDLAPGSEQRAGQVRADEPGRAGDHDVPAHPGALPAASAAAASTRWGTSGHSPTVRLRYRRPAILSRDAARWRATR